MTSLIGKKIYHHKILQKIGEGGMGVVYEAEDTKLKRTVAVKFLPPELTRDKEAKKRFVHEAQVVSSLDHPNICTIHEINETKDGQIYMTMSLYEGQTLQGKISKGPLPIKEAVDIAIQISKGLVKSHSKEIIHRDLKPANIMITNDGIVKILDFGLAKLMGQTRLTKDGATCGTIAYMSPEQTLGIEVDHRTDIWSLGVILYESLTGDIPFKGHYDQAVIYSIMNEEPEVMTNLRTGVPWQLAKIVNKALEKEPQKRYQQTEELLTDLTDHVAVDSEQLKKPYKEFIVAEDEQKYRSEEKSIQSLVVLPLMNLSGDPKQEYFTDGMTDALITNLAKIKNLKIISRTSAMCYKKTDKSLPKIAEELKVDAVVEGSVLRIGQRVRISAQLIHASSDTHLWVESYERDLQDILILQSELAQSIAKEINVNLTQQEEERFAVAHRINPEPYDDYLMGRSHFYKLSPEHFVTALEYFQLALKKEPNYALAYVGVANVWFARSYWGVTPPRESIPKAKIAVFKALELDDVLEEAYDVLGRIRFFYDWDWSGAEKDFQQAIKLNPNYADVHLFYSALLRSMKRDEEATEEVNRGLELDPLNFFSQGFFVGHLLHLGQYEGAIMKLNEILRTEPNFPMAHRYLWVAYHQKGIDDKATEEAKKYFKALGKSEIIDAMVRGYNEGGYPGAMNLVAEKFTKLSRQTYIQPVWIARLHANAGNKKQALEWLETAYEERDLLLVNLRVSGDWDILRNEQRFQDLLKRMNFPKEISLN